MNSKSQRGFALVATLMMLLVLTLIAVAVVCTSTVETRLASIKRGETNALYSTDGTVQLVVGNSENFLTSKFTDNKYDPFTDSVNVNPANAKAEVTLSSRSNRMPARPGVRFYKFRV